MTVDSIEERSVLAFFSPKELEKMARREYQDPPLRKTKGENPRWYIRVRVRVLGKDGKPKRKQTREYLGFLKDTTERQARRNREAKLSEINGQIYKVPSEIFVKDFVLIFNEKHLPTLGKGTQKKYRTHLTNHIVPEFGHLRLVDLTTEVIQGFLVRKEVQCGICPVCKPDPKKKRQPKPGEKCAGLSWWTRNDLRNILSALFTQAEAWKYWTEPYNPVSKVKLGRKKAKREKRLLEDREVVALLAILPVWVCLILRLIDSTGLRISEVLGLRWMDLDLDRQFLVVRQRQNRGDIDQPKSEDARRTLSVYGFADELHEMYKAKGCPPKDQIIFLNKNGEPMDDRVIRNDYLRRAAKKLGIYFEGFGFHSFRRGQITGIQTEGGANAIEAAKMAGHSKTDMTLQYTILGLKRQEELIRQRQERLQRVSKDVA